MIEDGAWVGSGSDFCPGSRSENAQSSRRERSSQKMCPLTPFGAASQPSKSEKQARHNLLRTRSSMKASILIPAYNAAEFIGENLGQLRSTRIDCIEEIIVVNDHSEDDTRVVVERFQAEHTEFQIILEDNPNKGRLRCQKSCPQSRQRRSHPMARCR